MRNKARLNSYQLKFSVFSCLANLCESQSISDEEVIEYLAFVRSALALCSTVSDIRTVFPSAALKDLNCLEGFKGGEVTIKQDQLYQLKESRRKGYELLNQFLLLRMIED